MVLEQALIENPNIIFLIVLWVLPWRGLLYGGPLKIIVSPGLLPY